jgi:hypothetical protein
MRPHSGSRKEQGQDRVKKRCGKNDVTDTKDRRESMEENGGHGGCSAAGWRRHAGDLEGCGDDQNNHGTRTTGSNSQNCCKKIGDLHENSANNHRDWDRQSPGELQRGQEGEQTGRLELS